MRGMLKEKDEGVAKYLHADVLQFIRERKMYAC